MQYNAIPSTIVQRTLLDMGICNRRPSDVTLLTKRYYQLRFQWAREHRDWTIENGTELLGWMEDDLSFITPMVVSGESIFQTNNFSFLYSR
ncbi:HTH_Tnp_Tc3_2 domain-containing protein [Trichonephila clavipes]|nr:HTH_Tnp_Tc3_2 domain-containing protein [Trichonephila clavipes]